MGEPNYALPPFKRKMSNGKEVRPGNEEAAVVASPDQYAHRRSYSDIYNNHTVSPYVVSNNNGGLYAIQPYTPSSFQYRERRSRSWDLSADPEVLRKKRLASYKVYGLEGKVKSSVKKGLHWVKGKYNKLLYGFKYGPAVTGKPWPSKHKHNHKPWPYKSSNNRHREQQHGPRTTPSTTANRRTGRLCRPTNQGIATPSSSWSMCRLTDITSEAQSSTYTPKLYVLIF